MQRWISRRRAGFPGPKGCDMESASLGRETRPLRQRVMACVEFDSSCRSILLSLKLYVRGLKDFRALASVYVGAIIDRPAGNVAFLSKPPANSQPFLACNGPDYLLLPLWGNSLCSRPYIRFEACVSKKDAQGGRSGTAPMQFFQDRLLVHRFASVCLLVS